MSASHGRATNERPLSLRSSLGEVTTDSSLGFRGVARIGLIRCNPCEQISLGVRRLQGYSGFAVLKKKKKRRQQNTSARSPKKSICRFFLWKPVLRTTCLGYQCRGKMRFRWAVGSKRNQLGVPSFEWSYRVWVASVCGSIMALGGDRVTAGCPRTFEPTKIEVKRLRGRSSKSPSRYLATMQPSLLQKQVRMHHYKMGGRAIHKRTDRTFWRAPPQRCRRPICLDRFSQNKRHRLARPLR